MLADDDFLRRLPIYLDPTEFIHIEALVFSADAIASSLSVIKAVTTMHRETICEAPYPVTVNLFTNAWAIVDCVHVAREMLKALRRVGPLSTAFLDAYQSATVLRNQMDHLRSNARNVASAKKRPPIFGTLGYVCIPQHEIKFEENGRTTFGGGGTVLLSTGRFGGGGEMTFVNPADVFPMSGPVDGFVLSAFDDSLKLQDVADSLRGVLAEVSKELEEACLSQAAVVAKENNVPVEKLLANEGAGFSMYVAFRADQVAPKQEKGETP